MITLCDDKTASRGLDYLYLTQEDDMSALLSSIIVQTQGPHRVFQSQNEFTHIFRFLDTLLPGLRVFVVWSMSDRCAHRPACEWMDQVYLHYPHAIVLKAIDCTHIHFREILHLFADKEKSGRVYYS